MEKLPEDIQKFFEEKGRKGGKATAKKLGTKHYSDIAKKAWLTRKRAVDKSA